MILDAAAIGEYQSCRRKFLLSLEWRPVRWRPKQLFDACLRHAIIKLSRAGGDGAVLATEASAQYMSAAANPGLDLPPGANPYEIAKDYCAMLETIIRSLAKMTVMMVREQPDIKLTGSIFWRFLAQADDSGTLHRWITLDNWGQADLARELHSWWVIADIVMARAPMVLHVIEIGQQRKGRRASAWARGFVHPSLPSLRDKVRFRRTDGQSFNGWQPVWLADKAQPNYDDWVERMWEERVPQSLVHDIQVEAPSDETADKVMAELLGEGMRMRELAQERNSSPWSSLPMARNACDGPFTPCQYQQLCYGNNRDNGKVDPARLGFQHRGDSR